MGNKQRYTFTLSDIADTALDVIAAEDAQATGSRANRADAVARLILAERDRRAAATMVTEERGQAGWSRRGAATPTARKERAR